MKKIQVRLDPGLIEREEKRSEVGELVGAVASTYRELLRWIGAPDLFVRAQAWLEGKFRKTAPQTTAPLPKREVGLIPHTSGQIPTVWFNPLYYTERKQVWAGLAHAILHQLTEQLPSQRIREEFWLRLQSARINRESLRRDVQRFVLLRMLPAALFWILGLAALSILLVLNPSWLWLPLGATTVAGAALHLLTKANRILEKQQLDTTFQKYIVEPDYASELGLLHLVDHDLDLALRLLVGDRKIAVFIDDLDRCDPGTVNEIVLAINHFLSVQKRKAFFFLGMDMAMVAAALEAVHRKEGGSDSGDHRSFGWRFMEKFVQLPFVIPHLDPKTAKTFVMDQLRSGAAPIAGVEETVKRAANAVHVEERMKSAATAAEIGHLARVALATPMPPAERARLEEAFSTKMGELMAEPDSEEIQQIADVAMNDLELNPRTIKRYFCLVRVLRTIQIATGAARNPETDRKAILRTAHLLMNWPEFAQWLRDHPAILNGSAAGSESFREIDSAATAAKTQVEYDVALKNLFGEPTPQCLADPRLYRFLNKIGNDGPSLSDLYTTRLL